MSHDTLFATPREVPSIEDCHFYHVMELPGYPPTEGDWDLRVVRMAVDRIGEYGAAT